MDTPETLPAPGQAFRCRRCHRTKTLEQMRLYNGKVSSLCTTCPRGDGKVKKPKKAKAPTADKVAPIKGSNALRVDPSFGFDASIDGEHLKVVQTDIEGTADTLMFSRADLRLLFDNYAEWAALAPGS